MRAHRKTLIGRVGIALLAILSWVVPVTAGAQEPQDDWPEPIQDDQFFWFLIFNNLEYQTFGQADPIAWEQEGWIGNDYDRIWLKTEGDRATDGSGVGEFEIQAVYSRLITAFFEAQGGVRYDRQIGPGPDRSRAHLVLGLQGLAPYWFEVEPALFISDDGDISARFEASYDMLFTQRLILQPDVEINLAAQTVEEWGVGSGLNDISLYLRLRYEIRREFAPYIGVGWEQKFGRTAELARAKGEDVANLAVLAGLRLWF